jgi:UDP-GlcNAc:undecaprenyl-phosphate GlcNAc-1-phosphate transferase
MVIFWGALATIISFLLTWLIKNWALKNKVGLAGPRERDLHTKPTPRLGGLAIVGAFLLVGIILVALYADTGPVDFGFPYKTLGVAIDKRFLGILLATVFISIVMLVDDIKGVKPSYKLLSQIIAAFILILTGVGLVYFNNPFGNTIYLDSVKLPVQIGSDVFNLVIWADIILILWVVLLTNATNFIDGLDGLATTLGLIAFVILGILSYTVGQTATAVLSAITAGALIGFLPFNLPPAKMFLGDVGSMFIGLMLAVVSVISGGKLAALLMVFALVILNAIYVIARRIIKRQNPFTTPDQSHLHHRLLRLGLSPQATLFVLVVCSTVFGLIALLSYGQIKFYLLCLLSIIAFCGFFYLDYKIKKEGGRQR